MKLKFSEIKEKVKSVPGIYEIYTDTDIPLKVGIAINLKKRLQWHYESKQKYLKKKTDGRITQPSHMESKRSILAKHLYFDESISPGYDLKTERGRQQFLANCCYIIIVETDSKEQARDIEREIEKSGKFRYVGRVICR